MRLFSRASASFSLSTTIYSKSAISRTSDPVLASCWLLSRKYERTRLRSDSALPTYSITPAASWNRYTPGCVGRLPTFSRSSIDRRYTTERIRRSRLLKSPKSGEDNFHDSKRNLTDTNRHDTLRIHRLAAFR